MNIQNQPKSKKDNNIRQIKQHSGSSITHSIVEIPTAVEVRIKNLGINPIQLHTGGN